MVHLFLTASAAFLDTLLFTGYFFYGAGITATTTVALVAEVSPIVLYCTICLGAFSGDCANYVGGRFFGTHPRIKLLTSQAQQHKLLKYVTYAKDDPWWRLVTYAVLFRFVAPLRPVSAVMLGTNATAPFAALAALLVAVLVWSLVWLLVLQSVLVVLG